METNSTIDPKITLAGHRLLHCQAEAKASPENSTGGALEITTELDVPEEIGVLKKGADYTVRLGMKVVGKMEATDEVAFSVEAELSGDFSVVECDSCGIKTRDNLKFWGLSASQLWPLLSQLVTELLFKMGFQGITIPPINVEAFNRVKKPGKKRRKGTAAE